MSVVAHPFVLIPALVAVVTARSLPAREAAVVVALDVVGSFLPMLWIIVRRVPEHHAQAEVLGGSMVTSYRPNGYVSGMPWTSSPPRGVTARVSSNQPYSSNCQGRAAWK